ncbi:MAG: hypothetical protein NUV82_01595 [Candidatus Komeilibacteria bacterium]|nr:hypothetical protein [Candidatus Komeilibacteria bacterium]
MTIKPHEPTTDSEKKYLEQQIDQIYKDLLVQYAAELKRLNIPLDEIIDIPQSYIENLHVPEYVKNKLYTKIENSLQIDIKDYLHDRHGRLETEEAEQSPDYKATNKY